MSEIEKCAWCGKEPFQRKKWANDSAFECRCGTEGCPNEWEFHHPDDWSAIQRKILAARRKDFTGGYARASFDADLGLRPRTEAQAETLWMNYLKETK